ncbi:protoporphyrinogen oxidase [Aeromicrobium marinum DSM 15272]|uniref:Protoporphyrinogen oxidase n=2 Tax=Aeromicrobium marinum TaxID=219314 RepID=E2S9A3_9ACTN|nr:FAD-dependent oxidoreductase [Aeromicrobium marinum]EFQ83827.1 protoporphyrinogen oxidase [Aeromicrobium marinum DSM 15272]
MHVAVVGAGMAGLTAALRLGSAGHDVVVLEGSPRIGGKLLLGEVGGVTLDLGAESVLARRPEATGLIREVGLGDDLVHPRTASASVWTRGRLRPMPPTVMGVPSDLDALTASGIVTGPVGGAPAALPADDVSVGAFVAERAGREVVDRLVEPLLGGVYAGHADRLSLFAAAPQIAALAPDLLASAAAARSGPADTSPVFAGVRGGVGRLPAAVAAASGATIRTGVTVRSVAPEGDGWRLLLGPVSSIETLDVDAVVLAVPAPAASRLLTTVAPEAAFALAAVEYASVALVTMVWEESFELPGSGFLVPPVDGTRIKAATFSSSKWDWTAASGRTVVRTSLGRAGESTTLLADDRTLADGALSDLRSALAEACPDLPDPADRHVQRWGGGLPQYDVGHGARIDAVDRAVAGVRGLEVCGAAYRGVGIPAVIDSAEAAVARLLADPGE